MAYVHVKRNTEIAGCMAALHYQIVTKPTQLETAEYPKTLSR